jgi:ribokinase
MSSKSHSKTISIIVPGGLNTDIIGLGVSDIVGAGELTLGGELHIGPGGKSRNIAQMIATLMGPDRVAMIGRTSRDPYQLWKTPIDALQNAGVDTTYVKILDFEHTKKFPGVALIPINKKGVNQIYVLPGVNADFCESDIDEAAPLFENAQKNNGIVALTLEMPFAAATHAAATAVQHKLKVVLDPGGADKNLNYRELLNEHLFLIKPNEHEARILTGVTVIDLASARKAADKLMQRGIQHVLITHGKRGAYFFSQAISEHIPIPDVQLGPINDETGCGDQTMASLCASIAAGEDLVQAVKKAILAGTLQFSHLGVQPITADELKNR